jgi:hypothetical protein
LLGKSSASTEFGRTATCRSVCSWLKKTNAGASIKEKQRTKGLFLRTINKKEKTGALE